jgi:hypothetical protein
MIVLDKALLTELINPIIKFSYVKMFDSMLKNKENIKMIKEIKLNVQKNQFLLLEMN